MIAVDKEELQKKIDYVLNEYHSYLHEVLPKIEKLLLRIQRRYKHPTGVQREIVQVMTVIRAELSSHLFKEEETLFPMMLEFVSTDDVTEKQEIQKTLATLLEVMLGEHEGLEFLMEKAQTIASNLTDSNEDFIRLTQALNKIQENVKVHSKYEDEHLFNPMESTFQ